MIQRGKKAKRSTRAFSKIAVLKVKLKESFYFVWLNFIEKLDQEILKKNNAKFRVHSLEDLNITWNSFQMKFPRWKNIVSGTSQRQVKIIQRR